MNTDRLIDIRARLSLVVGVVFIYAAVQKIPDPQSFVSNIRHFKLMPDWSLNALALGLPWLELVAGAMLVLGVWVAEATVIFLLMSLGYIFGAARALALGLDISCGCFGKDYKGSATDVILVNAALVVAYVLILAAGRAVRRRRTVRVEALIAGSRGEGEPQRR